MKIVLAILLLKHPPTCTKADIAAHSDECYPTWHRECRQHWFEFWKTKHGVCSGIPG